MIRAHYRDGELIGYIDMTWDEVRLARNQALEDSDWRAVLSNPWRDFRQELRDLPQNFDSANDAVDSWPTPPE